MTEKLGYGNLNFKKESDKKENRLRKWL